MPDRTQHDVELQPSKSHHVYLSCAYVHVGPFLLARLLSCHGQPERTMYTRQCQRHENKGAASNIDLAI